MNDHEVAGLVLLASKNNSKDTKLRFEIDFATKSSVIKADTLIFSQTSSKIDLDGNENLEMTSGSKAIPQVIQIDDLGSAITQAELNMLEVVSQCLGKALNVRTWSLEGNSQF